VNFPIALVHWAFPPTVGGVETHLWDYSRLLSNAGHDVTVFTGTPRPWVPDGVKVLYHPHLDLRRLAAGTDELGDYPSLSDWFARELRARRIRLVHAHNLHHFSARPALALNGLRRSHRLALVHTYHSLWRGERHQDATAAVAEWDAHHAVSEFLAGECEPYAGVKASCTYLGIGTSAYDHVPPLTVPSAGERETVLLPARLVPDKGALVAVEAIHRLAEEFPNLALQLTNAPDSVDFDGEGIGFRGRLEEQIKIRRIEGRVKFEPTRVSDMPDLYGKARVVIYPSRYDEPLGLAPLEAMAAGRPVVVTGRGGLPEAVVDGVVGHVVADGDSEQLLADALAARIAELLRDPERAGRMGEAGRRRVRDRFDMKSSYLPTMLRSYREVLSRAGGSSPAPAPIGARHDRSSDDLESTSVGV
jgi:glycosyltransferase involved in cell wall biosynthesis